MSVPHPAAQLIQVLHSPACFLFALMLSCRDSRMLIQLVLSQAQLQSYTFGQLLPIPSCGQLGGPQSVTESQHDSASLGGPRGGSKH